MSWKSSQSLWSNAFAESQISGINIFFDVNQLINRVQMPRVAGYKSSINEEKNLYY